MQDELVKHEFRGETFYFNQTSTLPQLLKEIFADNYRVWKALDEGILSFEPGDVVLDLGANEGLFSIMLAKFFPQIKIIALEPVLRTYSQLIRNLGLNAISNVTVLNVGVGDMVGVKDMVVSKDYSGGSSGFITFNPQNEIRMGVEIITLDKLWEDQKLDKVKLMKCDIEGAEYDALYASNVLEKVEFFVGEFHWNNRLSYLSYRMDGLMNWVNARTKVLFIEPCCIAE